MNNPLVKDHYTDFINEYVNPLDNQSYRNISSRLLNKINKTSPGFVTTGLHSSFLQNSRPGLNFISNMSERPSDSVMGTYFHEVGGHGTENAFGINKSNDPTKITQQAIQQLNSTPQPTSSFQSYLLQPNELRARAISTNIYKHAFTPRYNWYYNVKKGTSNRLPLHSQLQQLYKAFNNNINVTTNYLDTVYKQGGKISKGQQGLNTNDLIDTGSRLIPIYGTYKDIQDAVKNPNFSTIGSAVLSGIGDIAMLSGVGAGVGAALKGTGTALKAGKFISAANKVGRTLNATNRINRLQRISKTIDASGRVPLMMGANSYRTEKLGRLATKASAAPNFIKGLFPTYISSKLYK